jgi:purine-binding chemotaxis protein CheW
MKGTGAGIGRPRVGAVPAKKAAEILQLVAFSVADGEYALDIMRIKEIINPVRITAVPKAPPFIEGVIELRGAILPVVDLRKRFDLPATPATPKTKLLVVSIDVSGRRMIVALIVDGVSEPLRVPVEGVRAAPSLAQGESAYFSGVVHRAERIYMILDLDAILSSREKITLAGLDEPAAGGGA